MTIREQTRPRRRPDIWVRRADREIALMDQETGQVHLMNDTALAIWDLCDGATDPEEMIDAICKLCGMHRDIVTEDVMRILKDFWVADLITWAPEGGGLDG